MRRSKSASTAWSCPRTMPTMPHITSDVLRRTPDRQRHLPGGEPLPLALLTALSEQDIADGGKDKIEDQQLRSLPIRRAHIALKDRVGQRQHGREQQDRQGLSQPILQREP